MQFSIFILLICLFIFLYCVYVLANDDFIFLRRDVTMEKLFNMIFLGSFSGLFFARLFYGLFYENSIFSNPLVFLLFSYFPGLSLLGGVVGISAYLLSSMRRRERSLPMGRICDFFSIAFLISLSIGYIGFLMFSEKGAEIVKLGVQAISYLMLFIVFVKFLLPRLLSGKFKEGTISFLFLLSFSMVSLILNAFSRISILEYFKNFENIILILILIFFAGILIWHENLLLKIKYFKKGK
ncbi:MAG: prolipoprotein diacylglyceryl transferase [Candidatus Levybacteria bacterium]|nr:prolipoprotein diacylglyceryl transferase [Candidatus Levybacteria bacterium]MDZ4228331.1 prolipoprotein diacylglyceryl transferase family protein [Candidatus Levybacteria bacterium]